MIDRETEDRAIANRAEIKRLQDDNERLRAVLTDLRIRSVEEGIHHFVKRIDAVLGDERQDKT